MSSWFKGWFAYGLGAGVAKTLFGDGEQDRERRARAPIRHQTEEEILADEKRYAEDARRLDAEDDAAKRRGGR